MRKPGSSAVGEEGGGGRNWLSVYLSCSSTAEGGEGGVLGTGSNGVGFQTIQCGNRNQLFEIQFIYKVLNLTTFQKSWFLFRPCIV